jgi:hypothetical protein
MKADAATPEQASVRELYAEGLRYLMGEGNLNNALAQLCEDLDAHDIDYMVIGAVALMAHGYPHFTEDIDLVTTREGLDAFHRERVLGYLPAFEGARKRLRATRGNVLVKVKVAGEFPGDGEPKPVSFPDPASASVVLDGVRVVTLERLVELKLASGMTAPDRLKDLADVQELIKARGLRNEFADGLDFYVSEQYMSLWSGVERSRRRDAEG